jgi:hypothetical protein
VLAKGKSVKRKGEVHHDSCIRVEDKSKKDRPFTEGSRGCQALLWLDAQNLNAKECHFILPLVIKNFIMQSIAFIYSFSQGRIKFIFLALIDHRYLERALASPTRLRPDGSFAAPTAFFSLTRCEWGARACWDSTRRL